MPESSIHPHAAHARTLLQQGDAAQARQVLDAAIAGGESNAELLFLRGLAHARLSAQAIAVQDFDAALALSPGNPAILFNRALAHHALDAADEALADFTEVARLHPAASDAHANAGILLMRMDRHPEAVVHLRRAADIATTDLNIKRSLGNALQGAGHGGEALALLAACEQAAGHDPAVLTDHGMALLANGQAAAAGERFRRALRLRPHDQTALAGLYLAASATGDAETVDVLMDHARLLACVRAPADLDLVALRRDALTHPSLRWEPAGRSTRRGQQSVMLDLTTGSPFAHYAQAITACVERRIAQVGDDPGLAGHPWAQTAPRHWRIQSWVTVLHTGGHQSPHIHPAGWLSGVLYVDSGNATEGGDGDILFGHVPSIGLDITPRDAVHRPETGQLITFPSYYFHHTRPYRGARPRISLAFDVIPLD